MNVAYSPFSERVNKAPHLIGNVVAFINRYSFGSPDQLGTEDINNLTHFLDEFLGVSLQHLLEYCEEPFDDVIRLFDLVCEKDVTSIQKHSGILPWSTNVALCVLNHAVVESDGKKLIFRKTAARSCLANPDQTSSIKAYLQQFNFNVEIPKEIDFIGLAFLGLNSAFAHDNPSTFVIPQSLQRVLPTAMGRKIMAHHQHQADSIAQELIASENKEESDELDLPADPEFSNDDGDPLNEYDVDQFFSAEAAKGNDELRSEPNEKNSTNFLEQQKRIVESAFSKEEIEKRMGDPEAVRKFIQSFEPSSEFISSIQQNAQALVLGMQAVMTATDNEHDIEVLKGLQKRVVEFRSDDETILFGIIMTGALSAAYSRTIKDASEQLSSVPDLIRETITADIADISAEARKNTRKLTEDMNTVQQSTARWSDEMARFIQSADEFVESMPAKLAEKMDMAIRSQTENMFTKAARVLKKAEEQSNGLGEEVNLRAKEISKHASKEKRKLITTSLVLVPILTFASFLLFIYLAKGNLEGLF